MAEDEEQSESLTEAEEQLLAMLPNEVVDRIDQALLAKAKPRFSKVAYVVGSVMNSIADVPDGIPDVYYARRVAKLVEHGLLEAQGDISQMRFSEVRLPSSPIEDSELEEMIAEGKYFDLGSLYADGQGVAQSYVDALKWYRMGANQGNVWAQLAVGRFYENAYGVQQSYAEAYFWYGVAVIRASDKDFSYPFISSRDRVATHLTSEQKSEIEKHVAEWKPTQSSPDVP